MKRNQFKITVAGFMLLGFISCNNSTEKKSDDLKEASANLEQATENLKEAILDSTEDYKNYMKNAEAKLAENDKLIAEFKGKRADAKKAYQEAYMKELAEMEEKNAALKLRIAEPKDNAHDKWENFKSDFNKQMDELGKSISSRAEKNMKK